MKKLFLLLMALFTLAQVKAQEKSVIQISTDNTDLILQVAPNGRLYQAYLDTQENYEFYVPPQLETYLSLEMALEDHVRAQLALGRKNYLDAGETGLEQISRERFQIFREIMER